MLTNPSTILLRCLPVVFSVVALASSPLSGQQENATPAAKDIDAYIQRVIQEDWVPGAAVVVVQGDKTILLQGYGMADIEQKRKVTSDTIFYIASSTKSFTGLAAAICDHRGELDLDEALDSCLSDATFHPDVDPSSITLQDLLTHTHGISNNGAVSFRSAFSGQHTPEILKELLKYHGPAEQGKAFAYSNIGYNVAGLAIQNKLNLHWKDLLAKEIFKPLKMDSTTGRVSQVNSSQLAMPHRMFPQGYKNSHYAKSDENMHAAGGLVTTASDLANWLKININQGKLDGKQVIPAAIFESAHASIAKQDGSYMSFQRDGYGLGWNIGQYDGEKLIHHFGGFSGFHCHVSFMPEKEIGVAILVNSSEGFMLADYVSRYAYDRMRDVPDLKQRFSDETLKAGTDQMKRRRAAIATDLERRAARPQKLPFPLSAYTGTFENEQLGKIVISVNDEKLEANMGPLWSAVEAFDADRNFLRVELTGRGQVVEVHFDDTEKAQRIEASGNVFSRVESNQ